MYKDSSLSLNERLLLQEIGLMLDDGLGLQYEWEVNGNSNFSIVLDDDYVFVLHNEHEYTINCNTEVYKLSTAGEEIFNLVLVNQEEREVFYRTLANHFRAKGITHIFKHKIISTDPEVRYLKIGEEILDK